MENKKRLILITLFFLVLLVFLPVYSIKRPQMVEVTLFGPNQYSRTTGKPDVYNATFPGTLGLGELIVENGTADGKNRVSSASILIDGWPVLGPRDFKRQNYRLEVPLILFKKNSISVQLKSDPGSYLTVKVTEEVPVDAFSTAMIGPQGGTVSVQNHHGDTMTLEIPPLALTEPTSISIKALATPPPNPIATNIYPGAVLEPSGLIFSMPIKVTVNLHDALANPDLATLLWLKDSNVVLPIVKQTATQNSIEGETSHFSPIIGGVPTLAEINQEINEIIVEGVGDLTSTLGILELIQDYYDLVGYEKPLHALGQDQQAAAADSSAHGLLDEGAGKLLSSPSPANPCGEYSNALTQLGALVTTALGDSTLAGQIDQRACTLNITPQPLALNIGESGQLTAKLSDPNGNPHSYSLLDWLSDNENVATITPHTDNTCTITAVGQGTANILISCDGLLGSAQVTVGQKVASVVINPKEVYIALGSAYAFTAKAYGSDNKEITDTEIKIDTMDTSFLAKVSANAFQGIAEGWARVTATCGSKVDTAIVGVWKDHSNYFSGWGFTGQWNAYDMTDCPVFRLVQDSSGLVTFGFSDSLYTFMPTGNSGRLEIPWVNSDGNPFKFVHDFTLEGVNSLHHITAQVYTASDGTEKRLFVEDTYCARVNLLGLWKGNNTYLAFLQETVMPFFERNYYTGWEIVFAQEDSSLSFPLLGPLAGPAYEICRGVALLGQRYNLIDESTLSGPGGPYVRIILGVSPTAAKHVGSNAGSAPKAHDSKPTKPPAHKPIIRKR